MPVLNLTTGDLTGLFLRLLPRGAVWPKMLDAFQPQAIAAVMPTYQRLVARDNNLLVDAFPATAVELLPDWELSVGLPDPCAGPDATIAQRQAHVVARLTQSNGPSIPSLIAFAAALLPDTSSAILADDGTSLLTDTGQVLLTDTGYGITITEFAPARADFTCADDPCDEPEAAYVWQVNAAGVTTDFAFADQAYADDPLESYGNAVLECELRRLAPAHTILVFAYNGALTAAGWDQGAGWNSGSWAP